MSKKTTKDPHASREAARYENPIPSREYILEHLEHRGEPALYSELLEELHLLEEDRQEALHRRIKAMLRDGQLDRLKGGYFSIAPQRIVVEGTVLVEKGKQRKVWILPKDGSARLSLAWEGTAPVYTGNKVLVATTEPDSTQPRSAKLLEILEQQRVLITGRFIQEAGFSHVIPHGKEKEVLRDILIPQGKEHAAMDGQMVVVELLKQSSRWSDPLGQVVEILGHEETPGIEIEAAIRAYELPHVWSEAALFEAEAFGTTIPAAACKDRLDLRHLPLVTIDGEDAKDFDDAVYCEAKKDGGFSLIVAIADVSYYVRHGSVLDSEAEQRGTSVYFPGKVIPMLPAVLSNELCSLKPQVDRLCMACVMSINAEGKITRYAFHEAIICSKARLTYTIVADLLRSPQDLSASPYAPILPALQRLEALYKVLKAARELRGAVEFESAETRIIFGENRKIERIEPVHRNDAHRIIEECMLCANVACARFLKKHQLPGLYRNHQGPSKEKLADLRTFLSELALSLGGGDDPTPLDYAKLLHSVQKRADAPIIQTVLLRSLSQAVYAKDNLGHFGLAYPMYAHFTSPIRRYPDLLVHRQIRLFLRSQWTEKKQAEAKREEAQQRLARVGEHVSMTERRADDAVRDVTRWLKCQYIQQHIGEVFTALISGVTRFGFFAELKDLYIDGLVHVTSLRNDYYYFDAIHHRLVGERSGLSYKLGDSVQVKVIKVDVDDRKIDFELVCEPQSTLSNDQKPRKKKAYRGKPSGKGQKTAAGKKAKK
jgi:ribonuclease R